MFCPKCRTEYREGFSVCSDCNSALVDELPPEKKTVFVEYEELLSTFNAADVAIIKSLLDAENITYYFSPENFMLVGPLVVPVKLMIKKSELQKAKRILAGVKIAMIGIDVPKKSSKRKKG
jgi:hypothetical protein